MKKTLLLIPILFIILLLSPNSTFAHPGNTDSSGCHTCRTNCSNWGLSYGEYHCHNSKGYDQPVSPIRSSYGNGGTGYTTPAPDYEYPKYNTYTSCPIFSSYNNYTEKCECNSGYIVGKDYSGKNSCISRESSCENSFGYGSRYSYLNDKCECKSGYEFDGTTCKYKSPYITCPTNSRISLTDSTRCTCDTDYIINEAKDACVYSPKPIKSNLQLCNENFGYNSYWNGTINDDKTVNCDCNSGYEFTGIGAAKSCTQIIPKKQITLSDATQQASINFKRNLKIGTRGEDVKVLQKILKYLNILPAEVETTGYFGKTTRNAVKLFQENNNLKITGYLDDNTKAQLIIKGDKYER